MQRSYSVFNLDSKTRQRLAGLSIAGNEQAAQQDLVPQDVSLRDKASRALVQLQLELARNHSLRKRMSANQSQIKQLYESTANAAESCKLPPLKTALRDSLAMRNETLKSEIQCLREQVLALSANDKLNLIREISVELEQLREANKLVDTEELERVNLQGVRELYQTISAESARRKDLQTRQRQLKARVADMEDKLQQKLSTTKCSAARKKASLAPNPIATLATTKKLKSKKEREIEEEELKKSAKPLLIENAVEDIKREQLRELSEQSSRLNDKLMEVSALIIKARKLRETEREEISSMLFESRKEFRDCFSFDPFECIEGEGLLVLSGQNLLSSRVKLNKYVTRFQVEPLGEELNFKFTLGRTPLSAVDDSFRQYPEHLTYSQLTQVLLVPPYLLREQQVELLNHFLLNSEAQYYEEYTHFKVLPIRCSLKVLIGRPMLVSLREQQSLFSTVALVLVRYNQWFLRTLEEAGKGRLEAKEIASLMKLVEQIGPREVKYICLRLFEADRQYNSYDFSKAYSIIKEQNWPALAICNQ